MKLQNKIKQINKRTAGAIFTSPCFIFTKKHESSGRQRNKEDLYPVSGVDEPKESPHQES
jgi:hypothetical protein